MRCRRSRGWCAVAHLDPPDPLKPQVQVKTGTVVSPQAGGEFEAVSYEASSAAPNRRRLSITFVLESRTESIGTTISSRSLSLASGIERSAFRNSSRADRAALCRSHTFVLQTSRTPYALVRARSTGTTASSRALRILISGRPMAVTPILRPGIFASCTVALNSFHR